MRSILSDLMMHTHLRYALEEIFGAEYVEDALRQPERAQLVLYERSSDFKTAVRGFQRLNYREEHREYVAEMDAELGIALICALLDPATRELVAQLGLNYL